MGIDDEAVRKGYHVKEQLGRGAYAVVFRAVERGGGSTVVIKQQLAAFQSDTDAQRMFREEGDVPTRNAPQVPRCPERFGWGVK